MKIVAAILYFVSIAGRASTTSRWDEHREKINQDSLKAHQAHFAGFDKWMKGASEVTQCGQLARTSIDEAQKCLDALPPTEAIFPKDRQEGETLSTYLERKEDEWAENESMAWMASRSLSR
jgi:hypothetical protein